MSEEAKPVCRECGHTIEGAAYSDSIGKFHTRGKCLGLMRADITALRAAHADQSDEAERCKAGWKEETARLNAAADTVRDLRAALDQERATTLDLAMLVRKMERELRSVEYARVDLLRMQALDYLKRKGLQGSVLRDEPTALLSGRGEGEGNG